MAKYTQRQILAKLEPIGTIAPAFQNFFAQVSGGEITAAVEKIYVGQGKFPELLCAPSEVGDITLTRHYDDADRVHLNVARQHIGRIFYNIYIHKVNCDLEDQKADRQYNNALLVGLTEPDGDASSGAPATYAMTFSIQGGPVPLNIQA